jgi:hypothetical protein
VLRKKPFNLTFPRRWRSLKKFGSNANGQIRPSIPSLTPEMPRTHVGYGLSGNPVTMLPFITVRVSSGESPLKQKEDLFSYCRDLSSIEQH